LSVFMLRDLREHQMGAHNHVLQALLSLLNLFQGNDGGNLPKNVKSSVAGPRKLV